MDPWVNHRVSRRSKSWRVPASAAPPLLFLYVYVFDFEVRWPIAMDRKKPRMAEVMKVATCVAGSSESPPIPLARWRP